MDTKKYLKGLAGGILTIILHLCVQDARAQDIALPVDEAGKITFLDVVKPDTAATIPQDTIFKRILAWVKLTYPNSKTTIDSAGRRVMSRGRFYVYTKPGVLREIHGVIRYDLTLEAKDNRYRYIFTNFVFEYYKQDRNYQYKATGQEKPLEEEKFPGWQTVWEKHKNTVREHMSEKFADLKKAVENRKPELQAPRVVKKQQDW